MTEISRKMGSGLMACFVASAVGAGDWANRDWQYRTRVTRTAPFRSKVPRPVEVVVDFPLLLQKADIAGELDPGSIRIFKPDASEVPCTLRSEVNVRTGRKVQYVTWIAQPTGNTQGSADIYFNTRDRKTTPANYALADLPAGNLLKNPDFEQGVENWQISPSQVAHGRKHGKKHGNQSLKIVVDKSTPAELSRIISVAQRVDVRRYAGQAMLFACDLLAERARYGAPVMIEIRQYRADGSRIPECAIQPRWLTVVMAAGQVVQFSEHGRFSHEAAKAEVVLQFRCDVSDVDTGRTVTGPEAAFTIWVDRVVLRAAERWPWPEATNGGFVEGALPNAPLNRGFEFTGQRRLAFNGASESALTFSRGGSAGPESVHWGLQAGTLEFWCRPAWDPSDGQERVFFKGCAYLYRLQSLLRKCGKRGKNQLEFQIADGNRTLHAVRGPAPLKQGEWSHIAATWDLGKAHLQLFVDGKLVATEGPGKAPWPSSLNAVDKAAKHVGIGITDTDKRSLPMQAFIGGQMHSKLWPKGGAAEAVLDEFRISDLVRYTAAFSPPREEFASDDHTRALWHFDHERHGIHGKDDGFVRSYLGCEVPPQSDTAALEILTGTAVEKRSVVVRPYAPDTLFEANRGEKRLHESNPFRTMPDPRFVAYRKRTVERTLTGEDDDFSLEVGGDLEPLMCGVSFARASGSAKTTLLPRWRANNNVVPFSFETIGRTLATTATSDAEKAIEVMRYVNSSTSYYDAHYCETMPGGKHRPRISYTMLKHLNIYPYDQCGPLNYTLRKIYLAAGISSNNASGTHHQFQQAYFNGSLRLFDLSSRMYWLDRDNVTVLSLRGVGEDPQCKLRQPGNLNSFYPGRPSQATFGRAERPHNMDFPLRPGERASVGWVNEGGWFEKTGQREPIPIARIPPFYGNGAIVYQPVPEGDAAVLENAVIAGPTVRADDSSKPARLTYRASCPYILTGARVTGAYSAKRAGAITVSVSSDQGKRWTELWRSPAASGGLDLDLRDQVSAYYAYWLKVELSPGVEARLSDLTVRTVFLNSALSLPGKLRWGTNRIRFVAAKPSVPIRTTCSWIERQTTDLGISLNTVSYYNLDYARHRNLLVMAPGSEETLTVSLMGRKMTGQVALEVPAGGPAVSPAERKITVNGAAENASGEFRLALPDTPEGTILALDVVVREGEEERRVPVELLAVRAALVREAEQADEISGDASIVGIPDVSGGKAVSFGGTGDLAFDLTVPAAGPHALWVRARWELGSRSVLRFRLDDGKVREVKTHRMIGFRDWTGHRRAFTKGYVHYPEKAEHWAWYRIPDIELAAGKHRLLLTAGAGAHVDALLLLPQTPTVDRAAMNLFHNWNYAPQQGSL
jgi:hypothetical protein